MEKFAFLAVIIICHNFSFLLMPEEYVYVNVSVYLQISCVCMCVLSKIVSTGGEGTTNSCVWDHKNYDPHSAVSLMFSVGSQNGVTMAGQFIWG